MADYGGFLGGKQDDDGKGDHKENAGNIGYVAPHGACPPEPLVAERRVKLYRG